MEGETRGRPIKSLIRQRICEILFFLEEGYGYEINKIYLEIYGKVAQKSIYYNLSKGIETEEFKLIETRREEGNFSWGNTVQKHIYSLGPNAKPIIDEEAKKYFDNKNKTTNKK